MLLCLQNVTHTPSMCKEWKWKGSISGKELGGGVLIEIRGRSQQPHGFYEYMYVY